MAVRHTFARHETALPHRSIASDTHADKQRDDFHKAIGLLLQMLGSRQRHRRAQGFVDEGADAPPAPSPIATTGTAALRMTPGRHQIDGAGS